MVQFSRWSIAGTALVTAGLTAGLMSPPPAVFATSTAPSNTSQNSGTAFPDTQNYWAQPFIERLTQQQILAGYPDGTFQPDRPVRRDEYASILQNAFNQTAERRIASGSVYKDVPQGYWAAPAIEEAYEMGFMQGYPGGLFAPDQSISRTEVLVSLAKNLNLTDAQSARTPATQSQANSAQANSGNPAPQGGIAIANPQAGSQPNAQASAQANPQASAAANQPANRQRNRRPFGLYPMAMTSLMQPFVNNTRALAANLRTDAPRASAPANTDPAATAQTSNPEASLQSSPTAQAAAPAPQTVASLSSLYADADQIPPYAIDSVAQATQAGLVVNHPQTNLLNPNRPATRGEVAAFIHQALVDQGRLQPLPNQTEAANFVVKPQP